MTERRFGRIHIPDDRDKRFLMRRLLPPPTADLPIRKSWAFRGSPLDQKESGTCVAHAGVHFLHCAPVETKLTKVNPYELYREIVKNDEFDANDGEGLLSLDDPNAFQYGTSVRALMKELQKRGLIVSYLWAFTLREAVEWVLTRGPVIMGTNFYRSMSRPNAEGFIKIEPNSPLEGGHAYLIRAADNRRGVARIVNSWNPWGLDGEAFISFENLERLIHEEGEAGAAVQTKLKPVAEKAAA